MDVINDCDIKVDDDALETVTAMVVSGAGSKLDNEVGIVGGTLDGNIEFDGDSIETVAPRVVGGARKELDNEGEILGGTVDGNIEFDGDSIETATPKVVVVSDTLTPRMINVPVLSSIIATSINAFNCELVTVASVLLNITSETASILPDENELNTTLINPSVLL